MKNQVTMYYRRRILLATIAYSGGSIDKMRLQKLLFLFTRQQTKPAYDFFPYQFGCYSFQVAEDARILANRYAMLTETKNGYAMHKEHMKEEHFTLTSMDQEQLNTLTQVHKNDTMYDLIYRIYEQYPHYAVNSKLLDHPRFKSLRAHIEKARPRDTHDHLALYTIGYEGINVERYMTRLIQEGISVLVDVRRNPFSMKYEFSKKQLQYLANKCDMEYLHLPELGIESRLRKNISSQCDYSQLFATYRNSLSQQTAGLQRVIEALKKTSRVALTCFEKEHTMCHRSILAEEVQARYNISVKHI